MAKRKSKNWKPYESRTGPPRDGWLAHRAMTIPENCPSDAGGRSSSIFRCMMSSHSGVGASVGAHVFFLRDKDYPGHHSPFCAGTTKLNESAITYQRWSPDTDSLVAALNRTIRSELSGQTCTASAKTVTVTNTVSTCQMSEVQATTRRIDGGALRHIGGDYCEGPHR